MWSEHLCKLEEVFACCYDDWTFDTYYDKGGDCGSWHEKDAAISRAKELVGYKYKYGGEKPKEGFDPSGLIMYIFAQNGIHLPRSVNDQWKVGSAVKQDGLKPGDILFLKKQEKVIRPMQGFMSETIKWFTAHRQKAFHTRIIKKHILEHVVHRRKTNLIRSQNRRYSGRQTGGKVFRNAIRLWRKHTEWGVWLLRACAICLQRSARRVFAEIGRTAMDGRREGCAEKYKAGRCNLF